LAFIILDLIRDPTRSDFPSKEARTETLAARSTTDQVGAYPVRALTMLVIPAQAGIQNHHDQ
jgi:hypothetical protein